MRSQAFEWTQARFQEVRITRALDVLTKTQVPDPSVCVRNDMAIPEQQALSTARDTCTNYLAFCRVPTSTQ